MRTKSSSIRMTTKQQQLYKTKCQTLNFTKKLYKGTKTTIVEILTREDEVLQPVYKTITRLGRTKVVNHYDIVLDLLTIPSDIPLATKMSGEITDDSSFVKTDTNSFVASTSKQSSRRSRRPYSFQLDQKIELNYKLQLDNNKLLI